MGPSRPFQKSKGDWDDPSLKGELTFNIASIACPRSSLITEYSTRAMTCQVHDETCHDPPR